MYIELLKNYVSFLKYYVNFFKRLVVYGELNSGKFRKLPVNSENPGKFLKLPENLGNPGKFRIFVSVILLSFLM